MRRLTPALLLVALVAATWMPAGRAQAGRAFTTNFTLKEFADRRAKIYDAIGPEAVAIMQGLPSVHSSAIFRQSNEFFYVTGVVAPQALVLMDGASRRTTLYLPKQNASRAATEGELISSDDPAATARITGADEVKSPDQLAADLNALSRARAVFVPFAPTEGSSESPDGARRRTADVAADPWDGRISREAHLRDLLKTRAPRLEIKDLSPILNSMREIKSAAEIAIITRASKIGGEAIIEAMRSTAPGLAEFEIDALAQFIFVRHGAQGEAYRDIVASGPAAMNAHHRAGEKIMQSGELVLMDYCPDLGYYRCDITRQWPVNGKFTQDQRDLYGFYLGVYEAVLNNIKPGITSAQVLQAALPTMDKVLASIKFSKPLYANAAKAFVERYRTSANGGRGNLGHAVGMATHDFGGGSGTMRPGLVFTIEPEFRIPEENIFIRLEDMIVITPTKAEILSEFVPRSIAAVEKTIAEPGLLQQYGKIK
ncbi:MAG TPA: aminopeptidase P N-terminal domain-containing protein [Vicinamibacterales bacterium]|nr:aminopeptidase P N-terminal domain-containing protein [Vicinamibacterales bacterium]